MAVPRISIVGHFHYVWVVEARALARTLEDERARLYRSVVTPSVTRVDLMERTPMSVGLKAVQLGDAPYPVKQVPYAAHPVHRDWLRSSFPLSMLPDPLSDWVRVELQVRLIRGVRHG